MKKEGIVYSRTKLGSSGKLITVRLRPSRAKSVVKIRKWAVAKVRGIYPELEQQDRYYWRTHMVHHVDKNPFNDNPENFVIILRGEHRIFHLKKYEWEDKVCSRCKKETVHLNNRCTVCHYKNKRSKFNENNDSKTSSME